MFAGPHLIGIQPNEGALIDDGTIRTVAPRALTFRFDQSQSIDPATFSGIRITRAGGDSQFGNGNEVVIAPGLVTLGEISQNEVVVRFAENLPDDHYRIDVFAFDDPSQGIVALRNRLGEALVPKVAGARSETIHFQLNLGALVEAIVPQPVVRLEDGSLGQRRNEIIVYFNDDPLFVENDPSTGLPTTRSAENPRFYQLLLTQETVSTMDDALYHPERVIYDRATNTARLIFSSDINELPAREGKAGVGIGGGTFRLRIGSAVDARNELILPPERIAPGVAIGDTLTGAFDLTSVFANSTNATSSLNVSGSILPLALPTDLPGGSGDPGRLALPEVAGGGLLQTINANFGPDAEDGITDIAYNFQNVYAQFGGAAQLNQITSRQKIRIREALDLWSKYVGVQFRETASEGITFAVGNPAALASLGLQTSTATVRNALNASLRIDPTFANSAIVFSNDIQFNTAYGEDFFRKSMAGIGFLLGLEQSTEVTSQSLMALSSTFLNQSINPTLASGQVDLSTLRDLEPSFPSNQDILHGRYLHRPDGIDVDLYRFTVDLGPGNRQGTFTAETIAQRLPDSSSLDTTLRLFKETKASLLTDLGLGSSTSIHLTAVQPGGLGNRARIDFLRTTGSQIVVEQKLDSSGRPVQNGIEVQVPRVAAVTLGDLIDAINNDPFASSLFRAELLVGSASTDIRNAVLDRPLFLSGGGIEELNRNDDYFSSDSRLTALLGNGVYYIGIAASGNDTYDPQIPMSGFGGKSQGAYELSLKFEPQVGQTDTIRDLDNSRPGVPGSALDGDGDGIQGGAKNFWFQTRPLQRLMEVTVSGEAIVQGQTFTLTGANGATRRFEFVPFTGTPSPGNIPIRFSPGNPGSPSPAATIAAEIRGAINAPAVVAALGIVASEGPNASVVKLSGERSVTFSENFRGIELFGRTVFVDKLAGVNADGSLSKPFNNISNAAVPNAFGSVSSGDIVRIVGNGGQDKNLATLADNFSYKVGTTETGGNSLEDGRNLLVPKNVTVMIDAGAAIKLRNSAIVVGSTSLLADRSEGVLQVLGTPRLINLSDPIYSGVTVTDTGVTLLSNSGDVIFTSTRDRAVDAAAAGSSQVPGSGNWGGILFRRDLDQSLGRFDLEDEGIFLQTVNHADIRFGGGSNVLIESVQQTVNPIQMVNYRPNITFNRLTQNASAAMSASPDSFEETSYQEPRYQQADPFTADYGRVGPDIKNNQLSGNSINGLFVRAETTSGSPQKQLTVAGRFDDTDIVHYIAENVVIAGNPGGSIKDMVRPSLADVAGVATPGAGILSAGDYSYQLTFVDRFGFESLASSSASTLVTASSNSAIELFNLPAVPTGSDYVSRRLYRRSPSDTAFRLVGELDASNSAFTDTGERTGVPLNVSRAGVRGRMNASLTIDPGTIVKLRGARIELGQGTQLLAEGLPGLPVVFTSVADDRYGAGGSFDTNNDSTSTGSGLTASRGEWAGIFASPTSNVSLDNAVIAFGGGISLIEGGQSKAFSALEIQQATARVVNSRFEYNANGQGGAGPVGRNGRLGNTPSTIFARFTQPILVGNQFLENRGPIIDIDGDSLNASRVVDLGRQTGTLQRLADLDDNFGPLIRRNTTQSTPSDSSAAIQLNGMYVRGGFLSTSSIWDDTDIVHMVFDTISVGNQVSGGELRLQSRPDESLVVKLSGSGNPNSPTVGTGFTATGSNLSIKDRIGGTLHVVGLPGAPVVLTSLSDDTVGAGRRLDGTQQTDTNGNSFGSRAFENDWRGLYLDQFSNDRNVAIVPELENSTSVPPGLNGSVDNAQFIGDLADNMLAGDERLRLGFEVHGFLGGINDIDTYSFRGAAGTAVWLDLDKSSIGLDSVIEVLDSSGNVLARSDNSFDEAEDPSLLEIGSSSLRDKAGPLRQFDGGFQPNGVFGLYRDFGSTNTRDAGLSIVLPGPDGTRSVYYLRVRSASVNPADASGGLSQGGYTLQVRLQEAQEFPGSTVQFADIRYANHGIRMRGLPSESPFTGEILEVESGVANNDTLVGGATPMDRPQYVGNLASTSGGPIGIAGSLSGFGDVDFYQMDVAFAGSALSSLQRSAVFDIDYADGFSRPDTNISLFYSANGSAANAQLVLFGSSSNIAEDRTSPLGPKVGEILSRGSVANGDPFVGPISLPQGSYFIAVTSGGQVPAELSNPQVRREPLDSVLRIFDDRVGSIGGSTAQPPREGAFAGTLGPGWSITTQRGGDSGHQITSTFNGSRNPGFGGTNRSYRFDRSQTAGSLSSVPFGLGGYSSEDLPRLYFDYFYDPAAGDLVTLRATSDQNPGGVNLALNLTPTTGGGSWLQQIVALDSLAGQTGIRLSFNYATTTGGSAEGLYIDNIVVGFAERGEMISGATAGAADFSGFAGAQQGEYQLEARPAVEYGTPTTSGLTLTQTFDTNDRLARQVTLVAPSGSQLQSGDRFTISDGGFKAVFEFNTSAGFTPGVTRILFSPTDTATQIAQKLVSAINSPVVQSNLKVVASPASSNTSLTATDPRVNLTGTALGDFDPIGSIANTPTTISGSNRPGGGRDIRMPAISKDAFGDANFTRTQGQVIIESNRVSYSNGVGIWSELPPRLTDPRDTFTGFGNIPPLGNTGSGVPINLPTLNDSVLGGIVPGVVIENNIVDQSRYAGIKVDGQTTPLVVGFLTQTPRIADGAVMVLDAAGTRVVFEFDDIGGNTTAEAGSGVVGGDGFIDGHVPIYYRKRPAGSEDSGAYPAGGRTRVSSNQELIVAMAQAINGSILVTNGLAGLVRATVGPSILPAGGGGGGGPVTPEYALYIEGASDVFFSNAFAKGGGSIPTVTRAPVPEAPQPFARIINNTIYGDDGTESQNPVLATRESNDRIIDAVDTKVGTAHGGPYVTQGRIGDNTDPLSPDRDVDLFKVELDAGDRIVIDVDTVSGGPATALRLFDSSGVALTFRTGGNATSTVSAPGPVPTHLNPGVSAFNPIADPGNTRDGFIDFTATKKGTYYVGVSSAGNDGYDPVSLAGRKSATGGTGAYSLSIDVYNPRSFVLSVDNGGGSTRAGALVGTTFAITQIPDYVPAGSFSGVVPFGNRVTFEFSANNGSLVLPNGNINVPLRTDTNDGGYRVPDIMRAIADAIDRVVGVPALPNHSGGNGPDGRSGPVPRVTAIALGGVDGDNGAIPKTLMSDYTTGFGHNRLENLSSSVPTSNGWSDGAGTSELYAYIKNAARIEVSPAARAAGLRLTPDAATPNYATQADQLLAENGVLITQGASPTLMNNVFMNLHQSVVVEETAAGGFGANAQVDAFYKQMAVVVTGNAFQWDESRNSLIRAEVNTPGTGNPGLSTDASNGPSNVNGGNSDFNFIAPVGARLVENAAGGRFRPSAGATIIDSAINSLAERDTVAALKQSVGIPISNILAPDRDQSGQLRADDPEVASPGGLGSNVFKDRGALDRADFVGPTATLEFARDNDAAGVDSDPAESFLRLNSGIYDEFRILLQDLGDSSDPFVGTGIDHNTVVVPSIAGLREPGANFAVFEGDRLLTEGIDYTFSYDATSGVVTLRPLAGIWRSDRAYRISINNQDRIVGLAPSAGAIADGDSFVVVDSNGGRVTYEFESGYELRVPEALQFTVPSIGTGTGGITDGSRFSISGVSGNLVFFEFDRDGVTLPGSQVIRFNSGDSPSAIASAAATVIEQATANGLIDVTPVINGSRVILGSEAGTLMDVSRTALIAASRTLALSVPNVGAGPGGVLDGDILTLSDGNNTVQFEFDSNGSVSGINTPISIGAVAPADSVRAAILLAIGNSILRIDPIQIGDLIFLDLPSDGSAVVPRGQLGVVGVSRTPRDGETVTFTPTTGNPVTLVLDRTDQNQTLPIGSTRVEFTRATSGDQLAAAIAAAIRSQSISGINPTQVLANPGGQVAIGGQSGLMVALQSGSSIELSGQPGVTESSLLTIFGDLLLQLPIVGGNGIPDDSQFQLTSGTSTVVFQYNRILTGATNPLAAQIPYQIFDDVDTVAQATVQAINASGLGITATNLGGGRISLGEIRDDQFGFPSPTFPGGTVINAPLTPRRGIVSDGEQIVITQGTQTLRLEFDAATGGGGVTAGFIPVVFQPNGTIDDVASVLAAAINNNKGSMDLQASSQNGGRVKLADNAQTVINVSAAPRVKLSGTPGGAIPVQFNGAYGPEEMKRALIEAINRSSADGLTSLKAVNRGGGSFFIENALLVDGPFPSYFLQSVKDLAGNTLKPNREDNTTQFTLLLPTVGLDFGDSPDPLSGVAGRYPGLLANDGARHVVDPNGVRLGHLIDIDVDGLPTTLADGDDTTIFILGSTGSLFDASVKGGYAEVEFALVGSASLFDGDTVTISTGVDTATFEFDVDGLFNENHFAVTPSDLTSKASIAEAFRLAVLESPLRPADVIVVGDRARIVTDDEDGISFTSTVNPGGILNAGMPLEISVTVNGPGVLEAWIDFNFDGDWDDPNEQIISGSTPGAVFTADLASGSVTRGFTINVPTTAIRPSLPTPTYARFRISTEGGLSPQGLALSGEVEDYRLLSMPGLPPIVDNTNSQRNYRIDEDNVLQARDVDGTLTPDTTNDDGILTRITDPDGNAIGVFAGDVGTRTLYDAQGLVAGTLLLRADGSFDFTPTQDYFGSTIFTARVTDLRPTAPETQLVSPKQVTVTITIDPVNDPPIVIDPANNPPVIRRQSGEDQVIDFTASELTSFFAPGPPNESNQPLIIKSAGIDGLGFQTVLGGSVQILNGGIRYTPPLNYHGGEPDRFEYIIEDQPGPGQLPETAVTRGTIFITLSPINDPPIVQNNSFAFSGTGPFVIPTTTVGGILTNDLPGPPDEVAEGQTLALLTSEFPKATLRGGNVRITDGMIVYTPATGFSGPDQFTYTVFDVAPPAHNYNPFISQQATGTVFLTVNGNNSPPTFIGINGQPGNNSLQFTESKQQEQVFEYTLNTWFSDPEGDVSFYTVSSNQEGIVDPTVTVDPATGLSTLKLRLPPYRPGDAKLTVTAANIGGGPSTTVEIPVKVLNTADAPILIGTLNPLNGLEDQPITQDLTKIFFDPDGNPLTYRVSRIGNVFNPTPAQIAASGLVQSVTFSGSQMTIVPVANASGSILMEVTASDGTASVTDSFTLTISSQPDGPQGNPDAYSVPIGSRLQVLNPAQGVLANDTDPDNDFFPGTTSKLRVDLASVSGTNPVSIDGGNGIRVTTPQGQLDIFRDGTFVYLNRTGEKDETDSFTYRPIDPTGRLGNVTAVTLTITGSQYQNPIPGYRWDVTADGFITPLDALRILNLLSIRGVAGLSVSELTTPPPDFYDVNSDGLVNPSDAVAVINEIGRRNSTRVGGEGELAWEVVGSTSTIYAASSITLPRIVFTPATFDDEQEAPNPAAVVGELGSNQFEDLISLLAIDSLNALDGESDERIESIFDAALQDAIDRIGINEA